MSALVPFDNANDHRTTALKRVEGKDLTGKVVVVTGANGTLGKEMLLALASVGATVVATGRSMDSLEEAKAAVIKRHDGKLKGKIECFTLDLGDYDSIDAFVRAIKDKFSKVDVLLNNAGAIAGQTYKASKYGLEQAFQTNFVSTVVLTEKMLPLMAEGGRIIHQSSLSHADASKPINWDVVPSDETTFGGYNKDYCESKWLATAYSSSLHRRGILSAVSDPGISPSSTMWDEQTAVMMRFLARYVFRGLTKTSPQAASCMVHAAVMNNLQSGGYYHSGNLYPPMRPDCDDPEEWKKAVVVLKKVLPNDLKSRLWTNFWNDTFRKFKKPTKKFCWLLLPKPYREEKGQSAV